MRLAVHRVVAVYKLHLACGVVLTPTDSDWVQLPQLLPIDERLPVTPQPLCCHFLGQQQGVFWLSTVDAFL